MFCLMGELVFGDGGRRYYRFEWLIKNFELTQEKGITTWWEVVGRT